MAFQFAKGRTIDADRYCTDLSPEDHYLLRDLDNYIPGKISEKEDGVKNAVRSFFLAKNLQPISRKELRDLSREGESLQKKAVIISIGYV